MLSNWISLAEPAVSAAVEVVADELHRAGCTLVDIEGVDPSVIRDVAFPVLVGEFAQHFRDLWEDERVDNTIRGLMTAGRQVLATDYVGGREAALKVHLEMLTTLNGVDALLAPGAPFPAPRIDEVDNLTEAVRSTVFTLPVNAAGLPSIAFPIGFSDGLPVGAQLIGAQWAEELLCGIVSEYQRATDWHLQAAPVASSV